MKFLRQYLAQVVLSVSADRFETPEVPAEYQSIQAPVEYLAGGKAPELIVHQDYASLFFSDETRAALAEFSRLPLYTVVDKFLEIVIGNFSAKFGEIAPLQLQIVAIAYLQTFVQLNFTGPGVEFTTHKLYFPDVDEKLLQLEAVRLLNIEGHQAYDLVADPLLLIVSLGLFEKLSGLSGKYSVIHRDQSVTVEQLNDATGSVASNINDPVSASLQWWRTRALQVHMSIVSDPPSILSTLTSILLNPSVANQLAPAADSLPEIQKHIQLIYFLECARASIHSQTEHLAIPLLGKARKTSELDFILSGAKAKRTKFQKFHTSALIVLAKSKESKLFDHGADGEDPESFNLGDDLLLEKPHFESLDDLELKDEPDSKRIKFDPSIAEEDDDEKLLPLAYRQEDIPAELKVLDPNNQPTLTDLDNLQLLLRLTTLRQTSPANNQLTEEEMAALVARILYTSSKKINWTIFSRALWERSVLETNKARTIERGILQMTSLVEEIGLKIKTRVMPEDNSQEELSPASSRLRFIHQLTLMPQWSLDSQLADKYMSLGVLRSAIEIYERLQMSCEAALCYAAVDNEKEAERILLERIQTHPDDARALSILGDLRQDPSLWEKSWEIGRYAKAKASLSRYYYSPPQRSGLTKNIPLAITHMFDCLSSNPLNYEHWFFYGCCGLESENYELAAEAFTRCVALDDSNPHAWSNLATALVKTDKLRPAFNALKKALRAAAEGNKSWKIYENYLIVAVKLNEWSDVLTAVRELVDIRGQTDGEASIDIPIIEKLVEILTATEYPTEGDRLTFYQKTCVDLVCNILPTVITTSARCWRIVARVELWRRKPWAALDCHEKAYRALSNRAELDTSEEAWNEAVEACSDLIAAYENLGERPGKHGAGDVVCKDWKYKSRTTIRSLMSKGKAMWEDSEGWETLQGLKEEALNH